MKVKVVSKRIIWETIDSLHNYAGWPSVARLQNGKLALTASAFRLNHICPFGKCVISYSEDEGKTWTLPAPVIDTPLDDRDGGITAFGKSSVIVTSFNNSVQFQRDQAGRNASHCAKKYRDYVNAYLDVLERDDEWKNYLGSMFRISHDCGVTFGEVKKIPVTCPHGPAAGPAGTLLYIGRLFFEDEEVQGEDSRLVAYRVFQDGSFEPLGKIKSPGAGFLSYEPHAIVLPDGKVLVHIRMEKEDKSLFTIFQCESYDGGKTFTMPHQILADKGGAPAHLILNGDTLISTYGYRLEPYGIRAMFSRDFGKTWDADHVLVDDGASWDIGYPSSVVLKDGSILTVYYGKAESDGPAKIMQVNWKYED